MLIVPTIKNNNNNDVDCFPWQDKQPVLPSQDISHTAPTANNTPPRLIESPDTPATKNCKNKSYDNIKNNTDVINPKIHPHDCPQSVTPTLETLCTLDTCSSDPTYIDPDTILSIMIWNQPIAQYQIPATQSLQTTLPIVVLY
jgi:hypothetical protein